MIYILCVGQGGNGGNGAVGAVDAAAGGGGGSSGGQQSALIAASFVGDILSYQVGAGSGNSSFVSISAVSGVARHVICYGNCGADGGNASGATPGAAGSAISNPAVSSANQALGGVHNYINAQNGVAGGVAAGGSVTLPTTGLLTTAGAGGSGVRSGAGINGGNVGGSGIFPTLAGGLGGLTATDPGGHGSSGYAGVVSGLLHSYGGAGGASSHGSATGAGLFGGNGGNGGPGCGGGGGGGCLTGGVAGVGGKGGSGFILFIAW